MRLGVFGGTFDPPHIGHLILAEEALAQCELDQVLWVLTEHPPHKRDRQVSTLETRLEMVQATLADNPAFELSRVDINRPSPHYAVDTLRVLRKQYPYSKLIYLMGGDSLLDLPAWHTPAEFLVACDGLVVMRRPRQNIHLDSLEGILPGIRDKMRYIQAPLLDISSSDLRQRIVTGRPFRYYLPPAVFRIIEARDLYRNSNPEL